MVWVIIFRNFVGEGIIIIGGFGDNVEVVGVKFVV